MIYFIDDSNFLGQGLVEVLDLEAVMKRSNDYLLIWIGYLDGFLVKLDQLFSKKS